MKSRPTIFISGVSSEFASFRDAVELEVQIKGCFPDNQSSFAPDYREVEAMLTSRIASADAVICLVGFRFGAEPKNAPAGAPRRSYTQMEFAIARQLGKPVYRFLSDEGARPRDAAPTGEKEEDDEAGRLQREHRQAVTGGDNLFYFFKDKSDLRLLVAQLQIVAGTTFKARTFVFKHAPSRLVGRDEDLGWLDAWLGDNAVRVATFVAWGGVGKTSLVARWTADLAARNWPGLEQVFAWSFYAQSTGEGAGGSAEEFIKAGLEFFGDPQAAAGAMPPADKGVRLAELAARQRTLLVLDGLDLLQHPPGVEGEGELKDSAVAALLTRLAYSPRNATAGAFCVITTRMAVADLHAFHDTTVREWRLDNLTPAAGAAVLWQAGARRVGDLDLPADDRELQEASAEVDGHALTLQLLGSYLARAHRGDIRKRAQVRFERADERVQGGHAFKVMAAYESWLVASGNDGARQLAVLMLLGFFDRPATPDCLAVLRQPPAIAGLTATLVGVDEEEWNIIVSALETAGLTKVSPWNPQPLAGHSEEKLGWLNAFTGMTFGGLAPGGLALDPGQAEDSSSPIAVGSGAVSLDAHALVRNYFGEQVRKRNAEAWREGNRRLYEYLKASVPHWPEDVDGLRPLYQAVVHGCRAGLYREAREEVFEERINRGSEQYATSRFGLFGAGLTAAACFFDQPWTRLVEGFTEREQSWLLAITAFCLRAQGRLTEAVHPLRSAMDLGARNEDWRNAAQDANNLSELSLMLGDCATAVRDGSEAVRLADLSTDALKAWDTRSALADALHQTGRRADALIRFREAEAIQAKFQPAYPLLYSMPGFRYCDFLLAAAEPVVNVEWLNRAATANTHAAPRAIVPDEAAVAAALQSCREVEQRAAQTFLWIEGKLSSLDDALNLLVLGRCALYQAILERSPIERCRESIERAVNNLRAAQARHYMPFGLLTLAWLRAAEGDGHSARAHLDEAWQIAVRGPMRLHMADVQLQRARLFHDAHEAGKADELIARCGYGRRTNELGAIKAVTTTQN